MLYLSGVCRGLSLGWGICSQGREDAFHWLHLPTCLHPQYYCLHRLGPGGLGSRKQNGKGIHICVGRVWGWGTRPGLSLCWSWDVVGHVVLFRHGGCGLFLTHTSMWFHCSSGSWGLLRVCNVTERSLPVRGSGRRVVRHNMC